MMQGGRGQAPQSQSPQPMQGPVAPAPAPVMPPQPQGMDQSQINQMAMMSPLGGMMRQRQNAERYQSAITALSNQLRQAQLAGAPPTVLSGLQAQLAEAQDAMRQAGTQELYNQQMQQANTGYGGGSIGSSSGQTPYDSQIRGRDALSTQLLASLFGMGYGRPSGPPIG